MSAAAGCTRGYWCEVIAEGPVYGRDDTARVVLGTFPTPYLGRALRWLRGQALRIAEGLDPEPNAPFGHALRSVDCETIGELGDAPEELRQWADREEARQAAYDTLHAGDPFTLSASDHTGRYMLTVWPVEVPASAVPIPSQRGQPTCPRPAPTSHRKPRRKAGGLIPFL